MTPDKTNTQAPTAPPDPSPEVVKLVDKFGSACQTLAMTSHTPNLPLSHHKSAEADYLIGRAALLAEFTRLAAVRPAPSLQGDYCNYPGCRAQIYPERKYTRCSTHILAPANPPPAPTPSETLTGQRYAVKKQTLGYWAVVVASGPKPGETVAECPSKDAAEMVCDLLNRDAG